MLRGLLGFGPVVGLAAGLATTAGCGRKVELPAALSEPAPRATAEARASADVAPGLAALLRRIHRLPGDIVQVAAAPGTPRGGALSAVALAPDWDRPALLAAQLADGTWAALPLAPGQRVEALELRDLLANGSPELIAHLLADEGRVDSDVTVRTLTIWRVGPAGFDPVPLFDQLVELDKVPRVGAPARLPTRVRFEVSFTSKTPDAPVDLSLTLREARIDREDPTFAEARGYRQPADAAGRYRLRGGRYVRDPRPPAPPEPSPSPAG